MESYILFATLSPFLWAVVNIIDDYQIKRVYKNPSLATIMTGIFLLVPLLISYYKAEAFELQPAIFGMTAGIIMVLSNWLYFRALAEEETSIVIALWSLTPVGVYILSFLFLGEVLSTNQTIGSVIIILGSLVISLLGNKRYHFSPSLLIMLVASVLYAVNSLLEKETYNRTEDFFSGFFFITLGMVIGTCFFLFKRQNFFTAVTLLKTKNKYLWFIIVSEIINILAIFFQDKALSLGSVTLVKVIEGLQPIFVLILTLSLSLFIVYFRKSTDYKTIIAKLLLMLFMLVGFSLVF